MMSNHDKNNGTITTISEKVDLSMPETTVDFDHQDLKKKEFTVEENHVNDASVNRQQWGNQLEFLLSCISMSVGIGNVWRFPYMAYANGGGAFLIPYLIILVVVSRPLYYMEMSLGQFCGFATVKMWNLSPIFRGVGYGQLIVTGTIAIYYAFVMALNIFYFFHSFKKTLPWEYCEGDWGASPYCLGVHDDYGYCPPGQTPPSNMVCNDTVNSSMLIASTELFFENFVTKVYPESVGIDNGIGNPDWVLVLCLLFCWTCNTCILFKGTDSTGKVAYFTAIFPYVVMIILLVKGAMLPGAKDGVLYFFTPDWSALLDSSVWFAAAGQSFFSLSVGMGGIVMFSSFNSFRHKCYTDALIVSVMDTFTCIMAGIITFCILGNLAHELHKDVRDVVDSGVALVFVTWPNCISRFEKAPQLFSVLFFLMMFTLGAGTSVADTNTVITIISDNFPKVKRWIITLSVCAAGFLIGIVFTTPGGLYLFELINFYAGGFVLYIIVIFEVYGVMFLYGMNRFFTDIEFMLGFKHGWYWKICWGGIIPIFLLVVIIFTFIDWIPVTYGSYEYSGGGTAVGAVIASVSCVMIPLWAIKEMYRHDGSLLQRLIKAIKPNEKWGPKDKRERQAWMQAHEKRDRSRTQSITGFLYG